MNNLQALRVCLIEQVCHGGAVSCPYTRVTLPFTLMISYFYFNEVIKGCYINL